MKTSITGWYLVKVTDTFGCYAADTVQLTTMLPLPVNFLPDDSSLCKGNILQLTSQGYKTYAWSTGSSNAFIDVTASGTYHLRVTNRYDCKGVDSVTIFFKECVPIQIPNAFTPDKDGKNDTFKPLVPAPLKDYQLLIMNRWGQQLFATTNRAMGWDGTYKTM